MTDPPQIPASKPAAVLPAQTQQNAVSGVSPARLQISNAAVKQAPPALQNPPQPVHLEGRVISSNPQAQELRIATQSGEVAVQSSVSLPPDTPVAIDLAMQKGAEVATITVLRQQVQVSQALDEIAAQPAAAPPPLQAGDVVQAIYVPPPQDSAPVPPPAAPSAAIGAPTPDLQEAAEIIKNLPLAQLAKLPGPLPLTPLTAAQVAGAPDVLSALQKLPPGQQAQISAYLARPDVAEALEKIMPGAARLQLSRPALVRGGQPAAAPALPPGEEQIDDSLLQIVKAQTGARMAQEVLPPDSRIGNTTQQPVLALLKGLLPLLETLQPQESPLSPLARQMMPSMQAAGTPLAELMPKSIYEVTVVSIIPPGEPPLPPQTGELQGTVESISPRGFPVVRVDNELFVFKSLATVPRDSILTFRAIPLTAEQAIAAAKPLENADWFHPLLSDSWPALQETMQAVSASAPMLAEALRDTIPAATPRLVPTALFFLAALRLGSVESWLGEPVLQTLRQAGKNSLIERLTSDFGKIAQQAKETVAGDWRAISMPLRHDDGISQLQFFVRQQHDDKGGKKEDDGPRPVTRFVLNLRLSRLGDMQLDGLLHQQRFDLILRSAAALSFAMRQDLMQGFQRGLSQAGVTGGISFQVKAENWVNITLPHQGTNA